eukprot:c28629_g3_i1 orf=383-2584(+)
MLSRRLVLDLSLLSAVSLNQGAHGSSGLGRILGGGIGIVVCVVGILFFLCCRFKARKSNEHDFLSHKLRRFSYRELKDATSSFSDGCKLGQGSFGTVYKGILGDGQEVAVKKFDVLSVNGEIEFQNELHVMRVMNSPEVVRLLGFCSIGHNRLLVYEYMHNGSLQTALFEGGCPVFLDWDRRFKIILDTAKALASLHTNYDSVVIHGDIKPSNILLDANFSARIGDFGLARLKINASRHNRTSKDVQEQSVEKETLGSRKKITIKGSNRRKKNDTTGNINMLQQRKFQKEGNDEACSNCFNFHNNSPSKEFPCQEPISSANENRFHISSPQQWRHTSDRIELGNVKNIHRVSSGVRCMLCSHKFSKSVHSDELSMEWMNAIKPSDNSLSEDSTTEVVISQESKSDKQAKEKSTERSQWREGSTTEVVNLHSNQLEEPVINQSNHSSQREESAAKVVKPLENQTEIVVEDQSLNQSSMEEDTIDVVNPHLNRWEEHIKEQSKVSEWIESLHEELHIGHSREEEIKYRRKSRCGSKKGKDSWVVMEADCERREGGNSRKKQKFKSWSDDRTYESNNSWGEESRKESLSGRELCCDRCFPLLRGRDAQNKFIMSRTPSLRGTICYVAPENGGTGILSEKSDIYSFGVLLLVIVSGRRPLQLTGSCFSEIGKSNLISWARHLAQSGDLLDLVDTTLDGKYDRDQATLCISLAIQCLHRLPNERPSMTEVAKFLSGEN